MHNEILIDPHLRIIEGIIVYIAYPYKLARL